ncbi:Protein CBG18491 [Caenorhabditis briggsae]|uniref:Transmembrane protein n=2 Tax=Caenorhabditis briggsae TaxID=6238 RepID=A0AAE9AJ06_CAEBR|nr:Protein CBG18491 [Caenorhabditis briggsae]ULT97359.1 hypothetical protein L3Y34_005284 [Caenorhabditis briggsae]CAP35932.1 Protein CBG18491 [Caenorhabditis briggsae]
MLLRRSLFMLDILVLLAVVVFLVLLPAERCLNFETKSTTPSTNSKTCLLHPVHHPEFSFTKNLETNEHLKNNAQHLVTVCHRLQWSHYNVWDNMYLILLPAIVCICLIFYTVAEILEFDYFVGTVQSTGLIAITFLVVIYTVGIISHEKNRIQTEWPLLAHAHLLGAKDGETTVDVPTTWQYSILMCLLSALFKVGRILIQHFIGDKKIFLDDDSQRDTHNQNGPTPKFGNFESTEVAGTTRMLNESRYSRIETD